MAAVFVPPSPHMPATNNSNMSTRRPPLANVPNATNSPHRRSLIPDKRARTDGSYAGEQPSLKRLAIDETHQQENEEYYSPTRTKSTASAMDPKLLSRRSYDVQSDRKLAAMRDRDRQVKGNKPDNYSNNNNNNNKMSVDTMDSIRQWQRHYRKVFPQFIFYFDSVPEDTRSKCSRQVLALGAVSSKSSFLVSFLYISYLRGFPLQREEKFFSRVVTHVVTCRTVPAEAAAAATTTNTQSITDVHTVNPTVLEKNSDARALLPLRNEMRREHSSTDVLIRARQMGMKIWALEKLQRMIATMNDEEIGVPNSHHARHNDGAGQKAKSGLDLTQVLLNERVGGGAYDREPVSSAKDLVMFKGPFIYIHDMYEKTKPVMVREYPKVARYQDGDWPQFRSTHRGRCPFVDESARAANKRERERAQVKEEVPIGGDTGSVELAAHRPVMVRKALQNVDNVADRDDGEDRGADHCPKQPELRRIVPMKRQSAKNSSESFLAQLPRSGPFYIGREPAASGVQPSNITSATRSQLISSNACVPGAQAGTSKVVHGLQRKVLEKSSVGGMSARAMAEAIQAKNSAQGKVSRLEEDRGASEGNDTNPKKRSREQQERDRKMEREKERERERQQRRRDPKPGFCENCREKYDDFEMVRFLRESN